MITDLSLDDIDELAFIGKARLDKTGEYDISYYEKYIDDNIRIIGDLITFVHEQIPSIKDDSTRERVRNWAMYLDKAYQKNKNKNILDEYEKSDKSWGTSSFFNEHKYFKFIERDIQDVVRSYSYIINFMNSIYGNSKVCALKNDRGTEIVLNNIFFHTKECCKELGIRCPNAELLLDYFESYPNDPMINIDIDVEVDETNTLAYDVSITCLPYTVTVPVYTSNGLGKFEYPVTNPKPTVWYNQSYLEKNHVR